MHAFGRCNFVTFYWKIHPIKISNVSYKLHSKWDCFHGPDMEQSNCSNSRMLDGSSNGLDHIGRSPLSGQDFLPELQTWI